VNRLRILALGPDCNPEQVSMPFVTFSHAAALAQIHDVTLVVRTPSEAPVRRANAPFRSIEVIRLPWLDRIYAWSLRSIFRYNYNNQVLTASLYPLYLAFEKRAWRQLRRRVFAGEFDVVLRIYPMNAIFPSPYTLRDRAAQWRTPVRKRFQPGRKPEAMDFRLEEFVPTHASFSIHLSQRGGDPSRLVPNVCRV
jgi:hypothetical protein